MERRGFGFGIFFIRVCEVEFFKVGFVFVLFVFVVFRSCFGIFCRFLWRLWKILCSFLKCFEEVVEVVMV